MNRMSTKALDLELFLNFPGVNSLSKSNDQFGGYLFVHDVAYAVELKKDPTSNKFNVQLGGLKSDAIANVDFVGHPALVLRKLSKIIESTVGEMMQARNFTDFYRFVMREYVEFKKFYFNTDSKLAVDLSYVDITHVDECRRKHTLQVEVACDTKVTFKAKTYDLPECVFQEDNSLVELYGKFSEIVSLYQPFFDLLEEIDRSCWVLDPEVPKRKDTHRRIALTGNLSVVIQFNAKNVQELPVMKFLGPKHECDELSRKLTDNFRNWDPEDQILRAILQLLELSEFPAKPIKDSSDDLVLVNSGECCICFSMRLDDKLPEIVCPNSCCSQIFHEQCLYQWLLSLNSRKFYFDIIGNCPNCEKSIRCPVPKN